MSRGIATPNKQRYLNAVPGRRKKAPNHRDDAVSRQLVLHHSRSYLWPVPEFAPSSGHFLDQAATAGRSPRRTRRPSARFSIEIVTLSSNRSATSLKILPAGAGCALMGTPELTRRRSENDQQECQANLLRRYPRRYDHRARRQPARY